MFVYAAGSQRIQGRNYETQIKTRDSKEIEEEEDKKNKKSCVKMNKKISKEINEILNFDKMK